MKHWIYLQRVVGKCPYCSYKVLNNGKDDDPDNYQHEFRAEQEC